MRKILSIDPAINNTGVAVIEDKNDFFTVLDTLLIKNNRKLTHEEKIIEAKFGTRAAKIINIINSINNLIDKHSDIEAIVIEAPFYNALTPMAYGSILEVIFSIKYKICIEKGLPLHLLEPLVIKKIFANNRLASKEKIKEYLEIMVNNREIIINNNNISELSEHEIDSIAIGYIFLLTKGNTLFS